MQSPTLKAVLFDMDGTLTKFNIDYGEPRKKTANFARSLGFTLEDGDSGAYTLLKMFRANLSPNEYETARRTMYKFYEDVEVQAAQHVEAVPEASKILVNLKERGLTLGLVTNNSRVAMEMTLRKLNLRDLFDIIISRDDAEFLKPDAEQIQKALGQLKVGAEEAVYIGDSIADIKAARTSGVFSVSISTGSYPTGNLLAAQPDFIISSLSSILDVVDHLNDHHTLNT